MSDIDLVSIIMPSYNTKEYIAEAINSVLAQTYSNWELIIVDDCSTDNSDDVVLKFLSDSRINYYKNSTQSGAAFSRNFAIEKAKGKWIAFLDSDDVWKPEKLEKQINFMKSNNYNFSYTCYEEIDEYSKKNGIIVKGPKKITRTGMYNYCWMGCLTVMYNSEYIGLLQIENIKKNNDYAMWLKISKKTNCYLLYEVLASYRRGRKGSISNNKLSVQIKWIYLLYRNAEKMNPILSGFQTARNLFFGFYKKIRFVKKKDK